MKKSWNMKVTVIPIVIGTLGSHERIDKGTGGLSVQTETIQTTPLMILARKLRRVSETWEDLLSPRLLWKTIS